MRKGKFLFILHSHLPYVRHPNYDFFMEENWLFEAITETYLPLLDVFNRLEKDNIPFNLTISFTPTLMEMLTTEDLQVKYEKHLRAMITLSELEIEKTKEEDPRKYKMAKFYNSYLERILFLFSDQYSHNILKGFKEFQDKGYIEVVTCNGTHGFLPFMMNHPAAIRAQLITAKNTYYKNFNKNPEGIWLAECGYTPDLDKYLNEFNFNYFFVDSHAFWYGSSPAKYSVYRPIITKNKVFAFSRDPESSEQVWSSDIGYPGDSRYREFYRDIGFDRSLEYIKPFIDPSGMRINTGIKYHKITDKKLPLELKELYDIDEAFIAVSEHAKDFISKKRSQIKRLISMMPDLEPIIVAPFDTELFGHWWFEGPYFIENFFRELQKNDEIESSTPSKIIESLEEVQMLTPGASTWGAKGFNDVWLNKSNDWVYKHLFEMSDIMVKASKYDDKDPTLIRILNQMAKELLLAQASDWAFIMTTGTTVEYAVKRTKEHINRFFELFYMFDNKIDEKRLKEIEWLDKIFDDLDYKIFRNNC